MRYQASMDRNARLITAFLILLMLGIAGWQIIQSDFPAWWRAVIPLLTTSPIILAWLYAPAGYYLEDRALLIMRPIGKIRIPLREVVSVRKVDKKELGTLIKIAGSSGMFGYYGRFRSTRMGRLKLHITKKSGLVLITTDNDDKILISPDDLSFADKLQRLIGQQAAGSRDGIYATS